MLREIVEYKLVDGDRLMDLSIGVNHFIANGWQPLGGIVTFISGNNRATLLQSMVKYKEENKQVTYTKIDMTDRITD